MMKIPTNPNPFFKTTLLLLIVITSSICVFGIDGTNGIVKKSSKVFSTIQADLKLSIHSGFQYTGSHVLNTQRSSNALITNAIVTYQKRNITWVIPQKTKVSILNRFKTPSQESH